MYHLLQAATLQQPGATAFTWGFGKYGQLGNGGNTTAELPQPLNIKNTIILDICSGGHFTACLVEHVASKEHRVLTCGCGKYGRTGLGSEDDCSTMKQLALPKDVLQISCGHWHACCISSGYVYSWGYNKSHCVVAEGLPPMVLSPVQLSLAPLKFQLVSCGYNFTYAVAENGMCYSWGAGKYGVLGNGSEQDNTKPVPISTLNDVKHVSCGYCHVALATSSGELYTLGKGKDGALGHGSDLTNKFVPTKVANIQAKEISNTSCSQGEHHGHTLVCSTDGTVLSCGDGYKGKLGLGDQNSQHQFTAIDQQYFLHQRVTQVSAGGIHSSAVTEEGLVFTWGCGSDGRLGHPESSGHRYLFRSDIPKLVEGIPKHLKVNKVSCSYYHTAVLSHT